MNYAAHNVLLYGTVTFYLSKNSIALGLGIFRVFHYPIGYNFLIKNEGNIFHFCEVGEVCF